MDLTREWLAAQGGMGQTSSHEAEEGPYPSVEEPSPWLASEGHLQAQPAPQHPGYLAVALQGQPASQHAGYLASGLPPGGGALHAVQGQASAPWEHQKRPLAAEELLGRIPDEPLQKRQREYPARRASSAPAPSGSDVADWPGTIDFWRSQGRWPQKYFAPHPIGQLLARRKSSCVDHQELAAAGSATSSDQRPREEKIAPYRDPHYRALLAAKGGYMERSPEDIDAASKALCQALLETNQSVPRDSLFRDDIFQATCIKVQDRNEARVIRDITPLIVPPVEILATGGATNLECLVESVNEGWNNSFPLTPLRPQPDYAVGFRREAFTEEQLDKMAPVIGDLLDGDQSYIMGTWYMYFPFLTCEAHCGPEAVEIADRQNAHSGTLAARAVVELFRVVSREHEVDRQILAFTVSHDHCSVRIYGHYPVVDGDNTKYYRHPIDKFDFTTQGGRKKWAAYQFTKNVYDMWMPGHFRRICSAIDQMSRSDFDIESQRGAEPEQELQTGRAGRL